MLASPFAANKNKKRDKSSSWCKPRSRGKSSVGLPFTETDAVAVPTHSLIHLRHNVRNDILPITSSRYPQSTESYTFSKFTLNNKRSFLDFQASSTTSLAIKIPSRICLFLTNADWIFDTTLPITCLNLFARIFAKILYRLPTNEIGRNSFKDWELSTLGIRAMNVEFIPFDNLPFLWNYVTNCTISSFISCQKFLMNLRLIPSGLELLKLSQSHIDALISSIEKDLVKPPLSIKERFRNLRCPTLGCTILGSRKWFLKCVNTVWCTGWTPSTTAPFTKIEDKELNLLLAAKTEWNFLELVSPSWCQFNLDCCQQILVLRQENEWISVEIPWNSPSSSSDNSSFPLLSKDACLFFQESIFAGKLWVLEACHSFRATLMSFNFSLRTKPPHPNT